MKVTDNSNVNNTALLVPIQPEVWVVDKNVLGQPIFRWRSDYNNLNTTYDTPEQPPFPPFSDDVTPKNTGICIRWQLPLGLRRAQQTTSQSDFEFPVLPNRWLIVRSSTVSPPNWGTSTPSVKQWIIESDYINNSNDDTTQSSTYPYSNSSGNPIQIYLGKRYDLANWQEQTSVNNPLPNNYIGKNLTATSSGDHAFLTYQPYHANVFSMWDDLTGIDNSTSQSISYSVVGWYAPNISSQDPVQIFQTSNQPLSFTDFFKNNYLWDVSQIVSNESQDLQQTILHGNILNVLWNVTSTIQSTSSSEEDSPTYELAIGNTSFDALAALISNKLTGLSDSTLLTAFNNNMLDDLEEATGEEQLAHAQHQASFNSQSGGIYWEVVNLKENNSSNIQLSTEQANNVNTLNTYQAQYEYNQRLLENYQWYTYVLWQKYNNIGNDPTGAQLKSEISSTISALISFITQKQSTMQSWANQLAAALKTAQDSLNAPTTLNSLNDGNSPNSYSLKKTQKPSFWSPRDPVTMVTNIPSPGWDDASTTPILCRSYDQIVNQVSWENGQDQTITLPTSSTVYPKLPLPNNFPSSISAVIPNLWSEFCLLNDGLTQLFGVGNENTTPNPFINLTAGQVLPDLIISFPTWQQPTSQDLLPNWKPLFLDWQVLWCPIPYTYWTFGQHETIQNIIDEDYRIDASSGLGNFTPQWIPYSGRTLLIPQVSFSFNQQLTKLINQYPELGQFGLNINDISTQLEEWRLLSQRLSGLNGQFSLQDNRQFRTPQSNDPNFPNISSAINGQTGRIGISGDTYQDPSNFQPLRAGQLVIARLNVVSRFGQTISVVNHVSNPPVAPTLAIQLDLKPDTSLIAPLPSVSSSSITGYNPDEVIQLPPRIMQSLRLNFDWVDATNDKNSLTYNYQINPVCGWIVPNYLDQAFQVYSPDGSWLGELRQITQGTTSYLAWDSSPIGKYASIDSLPDTYSHLKNMLTSLKMLTTLTFQPMNDLNSVINAAFINQSLPSIRYLNYLSAYQGRALALVRTQWQWELAFPPNLDLSWIATDTLCNTLNERITPIDSNNSHPTILKDTTQDINQIPFKIRVGNVNLGGVVGYFQQSSDNSYSKFYSPYCLANNSNYIPPDDYIQPVLGQEFSLPIPNPSSNPQSLNTPPTAQPFYTTLLLDPSLPVYAYSDIVPVITATLPSRFTDQPLKNIEATFRLGPLLLKEHSPTPAVSSNVVMPKPAQGKGWLWSELNLLKDNSTQIIPYGITSTDTTARFDDKCCELIEGWLVLPNSTTQLNIANNMTDSKQLQTATDTPNFLLSYSPKSTLLQINDKNQYSFTFTVQPLTSSGTVNCNYIAFSFPSDITIDFSDMKVTDNDNATWATFIDHNVTNSFGICPPANTSSISMNSNYQVSISFSNVSIHPTSLPPYYIGIYESTTLQPLQQITQGDNNSLLNINFPVINYSLSNFIATPASFDASVNPIPPNTLQLSFQETGKYSSLNLTWYPATSTSQPKPLTSTDYKFPDAINSTTTFILTGTYIDFFGSKQTTTTSCIVFDTSSKINFFEPVVQYIFPDQPLIFEWNVGYGIDTLKLIINDSSITIPISTPDQDLHYTTGYTVDTSKCGPPKSLPSSSLGYQCSLQGYTRRPSTISTCTIYTVNPIPANQIWSRTLATSNLVNCYVIDKINNILYAVQQPTNNNFGCWNAINLDTLKIKNSFTDNNIVNPVSIALVQMSQDNTFKPRLFLVNQINSSKPGNILALDDFSDPASSEKPTSFAITQNIPSTFNPFLVVASTKVQRVYVSDFTNGQIIIIDSLNNAVVNVATPTTPPLPPLPPVYSLSIKITDSCKSMVVVPSSVENSKTVSETIYVSTYDSTQTNPGSITQIQYTDPPAAGQSPIQSKTICLPTGGYPPKEMEINLDNTILYVMQCSSVSFQYIISVIDLSKSSPSVMLSIPISLGGGTSLTNLLSPIALNPHFDELYIGFNSMSLMLVIDIFTQDTKNLTSNVNYISTNINGADILPKQLLVSPAGNQVYIVDYTSGLTGVYDVKSQKMIGSIESVGGYAYPVMVQTNSYSVNAINMYAAAAPMDSSLTLATCINTITLEDMPATYVTNSQKTLSTTNSVNRPASAAQINNSSKLQTPINTTTQKVISASSVPNTPKTSSSFWNKQPNSSSSSSNIPEQKNFIDNLIGKLEANRKEYESILKTRQQLIEKSKPHHESDFHLPFHLPLFKKHAKHALTDLEPSTLLEIQKLTLKLSELHTNFLELTSNLNDQPGSQQSADPAKLVNKNKYAEIEGKKVYFEEIKVAGDGWCTLRAAGIKDPKDNLDKLCEYLSKTSDKLSKKINKSSIIDFISQAIENNYQSSKSLHEPFNIEGQDTDKKKISEMIESHYNKCQVAHGESRNQAYSDFKKYIERPEVQVAYISSLKKSKYADSNIAAACLALSKQKLAVFIDCGLPNGKLINYMADDINVEDKNLVCIVLHSNANPLLAHYDRLRITKQSPILSRSAISPQHTFKKDESKNTNMPIVPAPTQDKKSKLGSR